MIDIPFLSEELIPVLNEGFWLSLAVILPSAIMGFGGGVILGIMRVYASPFVRKICDGYVTLIRGVPLAVQLLMIYYALPKIGLFFDPYVAAVLSFTICSSSYHSEYIRGALFSIRQGQVNAASALGMTKLQAVMYIIIPQAARRALPGCGNEIIYLIKYSSLAHFVTVMDIMGQGKAVASTTFRFTEVFLIVGLYYLALVTVATWILHLLERHYHIPGFGTR